MHFFKTVLASAALVASVVAKDPGTLAFSSFPSDVSAGTPVPLTWSGGNSDAVRVNEHPGQKRDNSC